MMDLGLSLGAAAVKVALKVWLRDHEIAADAGVEVADILSAKISDVRARRKVQRQFDQLEETVADRIMAVLGHEFRGVDEGERNAVAWLVHGTLQRARLTDEDLFAADLDPMYLERCVRASDRGATRDLSEPGTALYNRVLAECCTDIVELITALPEFGPAAFTEILRRETKLIDMVRELLDRVPARESTSLSTWEDAEFAGAYRAQVVNRLDRLRLFGVTLATQRYPLSVAYISLNVDNNRFADLSKITRSSYLRASLTAQSVAAQSVAAQDFIVQNAAVMMAEFKDVRIEAGRRWVNLFIHRPVSVEYALARSTRLLIRGEAGSGKTTLLQWLAVSSARYDFDEPLSSWNVLIPFFIPLRNYVNRDLPEPADFVRQIGRHVADMMPQGWVTDLMNRGLAVLLIDGVDELPVGRRQAARLWLSNLIDEFPKARYVVTSRPSAVSDEWLKSDDFLAASLEPMSPTDVTVFVHRWHKAVGSEIFDTAEIQELELCERKMQEALARERRLRQLATNPLMCALLCALHRDRQGQLPRDRIEIYDAALEMLLERRDSERGVSEEIFGLTRRRKMVILQALAYWLMRNGWSNGSYEGAQAQVHNCLSTMSDVAADATAVLRSLLERSGIVREPAVERIDFVHRTFQEYLAARAIVDSGDIGVLLQHAADDLWQEVFVLAVGYSGDAARKELLRNLLTAAESANPVKRNRLHLVALACLETAPQVPAQERKQIEEAANRLLPPTTMAQANALAKAGEFALDMLVSHPANSAKQAAATIRAASLIGGDEALQLIQTCSEHYSDRDNVRQELIRAWSRFDTITYARDILAKTHFHDEIDIGDPAALRGLKYIQPVTLGIKFTKGYGDISQLANLDQLKYLFIDDRLLIDLSPLAACAKLNTINMIEIAEGFDLGSLRKCTALRQLDFDLSRAASPADLKLLKQLTTLELTGPSDFAPIQRFLSPQGRLHRFGMWKATKVRDLRKMCTTQTLSELRFLLLANCISLTSIAGIETWAETLTGIFLNAPGLLDLRPLGRLAKLNFMNITYTPISDLRFLGDLRELTTLHIGPDRDLTLELEPLLELPKLKHLYIREAKVDLTPLRGKENLHIHLDNTVTLEGEHLLGSTSKVSRDLS